MGNHIPTKMPGLKTNIIEIAYSTSGSLGGELGKNTKEDIQYFSLTFNLMLTYACFAASSLKHNNIGNR